MKHVTVATPHLDGKHKQVPVHCGNCRCYTGSRCVTIEQPDVAYTTCSGCAVRRQFRESHELHRADVLNGKDVLTWLPLIQDCDMRALDEDPNKFRAPEGPWECWHPALSGPDEHDLASRRLDCYWGSGVTPTIAYNDFLSKLVEWQEAERERLDQEHVHQGGEDYYRQTLGVGYYEGPGSER